MNPGNWILFPHHKYWIHLCRNDVLFKVDIKVDVSRHFDDHGRVGRVGDKEMDKEVNKEMGEEMDEVMDEEIGEEIDEEMDEEIEVKIGVLFEDDIQVNVSRHIANESSTNLS